MTDPIYDVLVIGAGPAGSAAARVAAKAGLRVGIVDKARFPRSKLCGGLVTGRAMAALDQIFGMGPAPDLFFLSTQIRFRAHGQTLAQIDDAPPMYLTMRWDFDSRLHDLAVQAGADAHLGQPIRDLDPDAGQVTLRDGTRLRYRCLIGADGVTSSVAKALLGRAYDPKTIGFGFELEAPHVTPSSPVVEVDFTAAHWGYGWSFPKFNSQTIGVGGIQSCNADLGPAMARYVAQVAADDQAARRKGHFLPFGDYTKTPGRGAILLAGDAAGLVDPITGEGIALALESGALAAQAVVQALLAGTPQAAYPAYLRALRPIHRDLAQARRLRWLIFPRAVQPRFLAAFGKGSSLPRRFLDLLAGRVTYADLRGLYIRKLPKAAWLLLRKGFS